MFKPDLKAKTLLQKSSLNRKAEELSWVRCISCFVVRFTVPPLCIHTVEGEAQQKEEVMLPQF